jgi:hypothetical protein
MNRLERKHARAIRWMGQFPGAGRHDLERLLIYWANDVYAVSVSGVTLSWHAATRLPSIPIRPVPLGFWKIS